MRFRIYNLKDKAIIIYFIALVIAAALGLCLTGCGSSVGRPNANIYFMNVPAKQMQGNNIKNDYDDNGVRTASGFTQFKPLTSVGDVDKMFCTDAAGLAAIKTSLADARAYVQNNCQ